MGIIRNVLRSESEEGYSDRLAGALNSFLSVANERREVDHGLTCLSSRDGLSPVVVIAWKADAMVALREWFKAVQRESSTKKTT